MRLIVCTWLICGSFPTKKEQKQRVRRRKVRTLLISIRWVCTNEEVLHQWIRIS